MDHIVYVVDLFDNQMRTAVFSCGFTFDRCLLGNCKHMLRIMLSRLVIEVICRKFINDKSIAFRAIFAISDDGDSVGACTLSRCCLANFFRCFADGVTT